MVKPFIPQKLPLENIKWEPLIPLIGRANRALAHYDGVLFAVPNPDVLLSPMMTQEAVLSSRIEGTQATLGEVLKFEAGENPKQESRLLDIKEIINYRQALLAAEAELEARPFNLNLLIYLHTILLDSVRGRHMGRGQFRTIQNWIGAPGNKIEQAQFVPPAPQLIPELLNNWETYYHMERPDPLVQLAVIHAQFEIIHPFLDGNGRIGRILIPLFLYEKEILLRPMFYLSGHLEEHRNSYIEHLRALGKEEGAWNRWIMFFLNALVVQAQANASKARAIIELYERLKSRILVLTHSQFAVPLLDALFAQPIFSSSSLMGKPGMPTKPVIMTMLGKLKHDGILKTIRQGRGSRSQILALTELVNLCEGVNAI